MSAKAKLNQTNNKPDKPGSGHKAKLSVVGKAVTEIDGQKSEINVDWSFELTVEQIDYAIKLVAGRIAEVTSRIAGDKMPVREEVTA